MSRSMNAFMENLISAWGLQLTEQRKSHRDHRASRGIRSERQAETLPAVSATSAVRVGSAKQHRSASGRRAEERLPGSSVKPARRRDTEFDSHEMIHAMLSREEKGLLSDDLTAPLRRQTIDCNARILDPAAASVAAADAAATRRRRASAGTARRTPLPSHERTSSKGAQAFKGVFLSQTQPAPMPAVTTAPVAAVSAGTTTQRSRSRSSRRRSSSASKHARRQRSATRAVDPAASNSASTNGSSASSSSTLGSRASVLERLLAPTVASELRVEKAAEAAAAAGSGTGKHRRGGSRSAGHGHRRSRSHAGQTSSDGSEKENKRAPSGRSRSRTPSASSGRRPAAASGDATAPPAPAGAAAPASTASAASAEAGSSPTAATRSQSRIRAPSQPRTSDEPTSLKRMETTPIAPVVEASETGINRLLDAAQLKPTDVLFDLGCGRGELCVRAATQFGCRAIGVELRPYLAAAGQKLAASSTVADRVTILNDDIRNVDLSPATVVVVYMTGGALAILRPQFEQQLRPGTRFISLLFPVPHWISTDELREQQERIDGEAAASAGSSTSAASQQLEPRAARSRSRSQSNKGAGDGSRSSSAHRRGESARRRSSSSKGGSGSGSGSGVGGRVLVPAITPTVGLYQYVIGRHKRSLHSRNLSGDSSDPDTTGQASTPRQQQQGQQRALSQVLRQEHHRPVVVPGLVRHPGPPSAVTQLLAASNAAPRDRDAPTNSSFSSASTTLAAAVAAAAASTADAVTAPAALSDSVPRQRPSSSGVRIRIVRSDEHARVVDS